MGTAAQTGPVLIQDVALDVEAGDGTLVLSATQARRLSAALDALGLSGPKPLSVIRQPRDPASRGGYVIEVGDHCIELPPDPNTTLLDLELGPAAVVLGAAWMVPTLFELYGSVPAGIVVCWVGTYLAIALWAHHQTMRGEPARGSLLALTIAAAVGHTATATPRQRSAQARERGFPFVGNAIAPTLLAGLTWHELSGGWRLVTLSGFGLLAAVGLGLATRPVAWVRLGAELLWQLVAYSSVSLVPSGTAQVEAALHAMLAASDEEAVDRAFAGGRRRSSKLSPPPDSGHGALCTSPRPFSIRGSAPRSRLGCAPSTQCSRRFDEEACRCRR